MFGTTNLIQLLIDVLIFGIIASIVYWVVQQIPMLAPFKNIALAIIGLIFLIALLNVLGFHV